MAEFLQYNVLKDAVRAKLTRQSSRSDVEKIKKDLRSEMEAEFGKKITALAAGSNQHTKNLIQDFTSARQKVTRDVA